MGYNWRKIKMKKIVFFMIAFLGFSIASNAQPGSANQACKDAFGNGYTAKPSSEANSHGYVNNNNSTSTSENKNSGGWNIGGNASVNAKTNTTPVTSVGGEAGIKGGYQSGTKSNSSQNSSSKDSRTYYQCVPERKVVPRTKKD